MSTKEGVVYVVDDEAGMRKALGRLLRAAGYEVQLFPSARDFISAFRANETSCLVLDVTMPDLNGIEVQRRLKEADILVPIIFLTGNGDIPMSVHAIKAGAVEFFTKPVTDSDLLRAIDEALLLATERNSAHALTTSLTVRYATLTPREREVMSHVVTGKLNKQIAADLGTGEQNIKVHRGRVMEKMAVESLAQLVRAADRLDIRT